MKIERFADLFGPKPEGDNGGVALVRRHRPRRFEQIVGQPVVVDYLSGLIKRGQACRHLLLFGAVGSGKTTSARIYATALNCAEPAPETGSPCWKCPSCLAVANGGAEHFVEIDAPRCRSFAELISRIDLFLVQDGDADRRLVVFIDEAHALDSYRDKGDALLKMIEDGKPNVSFVFATTVPDRLPDALRSRLRPLRLRPLSLQLSIDYLRALADHEGIPYETDALALLAGLGDGQPRNMLQALDQVSEGGTGHRLAVTRERVVDMFGVSRTEHLCAYLLALGEGAFTRQMRLFFEWPEPIAQKAMLVQQLLLDLYLNDIRGIGVPIDALIASIRPDERRPILDAFRRRVGEDRVPDFLEDMVAGWPVITPMTTEQVVLAHLIELQRLANRDQPSPRADVTQDRIPEGDATAPAARSRRLQGGSTHKRPALGPKIARDPNFLTIDNVARLINAGSYVVAQHGVQFNVRITVRHRLFGCKTQDEAADHFALFSKGLDSRLKDWTGAGHRLGVQEVNEAEGFYGRIVASVPDPHLMRRWAERWHRADRAAGQEDAAIVVEFETSTEGMSAHWRCIRWICAGLNPAEPDYEHLQIEPEFRRAAGNIGTRTRMPISDSLKPGEIARVENELGLRFVSAFNDRAFDHLYLGWEVTERLDRLRHTREREAALGEVRARYGAVENAEQQGALDAELAELRSSWPDEFERSRSWTLWGRE